MKIRCVWEHNGNDTMLYSDNYIGAFTRGESKEVAMAKMQSEVKSYLAWKGELVPKALEVDIVQERESDVQINDADTEVLFDEEKSPLTMEEYIELRDLVLKSAQDFWNLYQSIPDKNKSCLPKRKTFYGEMPRTAEEMYIHTRDVNTYYFGEIGIDVDHEGTILECRQKGFELLERRADFLENPVIMGSYGEEWSLRKMLRRFIWHDRIHAKAMYKMAQRTFGAKCVENIFQF